MRRFVVVSSIALVLGGFAACRTSTAVPVPAPVSVPAPVPVPVAVSVSASVAVPAPVSVTAPVAESNSVDSGLDAAPAPVAAVVGRAREEVARRVSYDASWFAISYPNGDPNSSVGVCTDVVIRSYRAAGIDFQKLVHEDVVHNPAVYDPYVKIIDANIDHRRVGPLMIYLNRHAKKLATDKNDTYLAGDIVVISFNACPACSPQHIGVVSDKMGPRGVPLMIHNMGPVPSEDDTLDAWTRIGHYRVL